MRTIGLTGSIGMGKSTVAAMLRDLDIPVFDADAVVHALQSAGGRLVVPIEAEFPGSTGTDGVDRHALGAQVFGDDDAMRRLEAIVHPAVAVERQEFLRLNRLTPWVAFDVPLLMETGGDARVDVTMVVSAPASVQRARVLTRPGMTPHKFEAILSRQMPDAEKRARADYVIDTGASLAQTRAQVAATVACLLRT